MCYGSFAARIPWETKGSEHYVGFFHGFWHSLFRWAYDIFVRGARPCLLLCFTLTCTAGKSWPLHYGHPSSTAGLSTTAAAVVNCNPKYLIDVIYYNLFMFPSTFSILFALKLVTSALANCFGSSPAGLICMSIKTILIDFGWVCHFCAWGKGNVELWIIKDASSTLNPNLPFELIFSAPLSQNPRDSPPKRISCLFTILFWCASWMSSHSTF